MPDLARYDIVHQLSAALHRPWLTRFSDAWAKWQDLDASTRQLASTIIDLWLDTLAPNALPAELEHETLCVQLFNIAGARGREPFSFLNSLKEVPPPRLEGGWRCGLHFSALKGSVNTVWEDPMLGLVEGQDWIRLSATWSNLTPDFKQLLAQVMAIEGTSPRAMSTPQDIAWLDRLRRTFPPAQEVLKAYQRLSNTEAFEIADLLINQHIAWRSAGIISDAGGFQMAKEYAPYALCRLACLSGPLDQGLLAKASSAQIRYPDPILTEDERARRRRFTLGQGIALIELKPKEAEIRTASSPPAVRAGHADLLHLPEKKNPLFVLLDADLTRSELSFLKLKGTRLRICDWASHSDHHCFTKVDLNGGVELLGGHEPPEIDKYFRGPFVHFLDDRLLITPFEGTREATGLGAEFRLGGVPNWEQWSDVPLSPVDAQPMTFLAQFPHPNGGTAYLFLDFRHLIATVVTQWD